MFGLTLGVANAGTARATINSAITANIATERFMRYLPSSSWADKVQLR